MKCELCGARIHEDQPSLKLVTVRPIRATYDACSAACAGVLIQQLQGIAREIQRAIG